MLELLYTLNTELDEMPTGKRRYSQSLKADWWALYRTPERCSDGGDGDVEARLRLRRSWKNSGGRKRRKPSRKEKLPFAARLERRKGREAPSLRRKERLLFMLQLEK